MSKKIIEIDGYIGEGGYSSGYVKLGLREAGNDPVELHINSLGGDVSHAIAIKDMVAAHGDVTAYYSGMSASSATIIGLGAKKVTMTKDSFYLIHKPMMYVDAWGLLNEDELSNLISKFESELESAKRITLQMAKAYAEKTGRPVSEMLSLMKKEEWLTAKQAKDIGFVDEIVEPVKITNFAEDLKVVALIAGNGLPPVPREQPDTASGIDDIAARINTAGENWLAKLKEFFILNTKKPETKMSKPLVLASLCAALSIESLEVNEDGAYVNETQLNLVEARLKLLQESTTAAEAALATVNAQRADMEAALTSANSALDELGSEVKEATTINAKVEAVRTLLAKKPAAAATVVNTSGDPVRNSIQNADDVTSYVKQLV